MNQRDPMSFPIDTLVRLPYPPAGCWRHAMRKGVVLCLAIVAPTLAGCRAAGFVKDAVLSWPGSVLSSFANGNYVHDGEMKGPHYADDPLRTQR